VESKASSHDDPQFLARLAVLGQGLPTLGVIGEASSGGPQGVEQHPRERIVGGAGRVR